MDKFINSKAYRVKGQFNDNESISESIENSFFSKKGLPTLNLSNHTVAHPSTMVGSYTDQQQQVNTNALINNPLGDLLDKINSMNDGFNEPEEISDELDEQDLALFKDSVKHWIETDNLIMELDKKRRDLMKVRNSYNTDIINFMKRYKAGDVNIDNGEKLKFEVRHSRASFSRKNLQEQINNFFIQNHEVASKLLEHLETNRKVNETEKLKRVKTK